MGLIGVQVLILSFLNKRKETQRVRNGKPAKLHDASMARRFDNANDDTTLGANAFLDITDQVRHPCSNS